MSTSTSISKVIAFVLGIAFSVIAVATVARADVNGPIFLTRLANVIRTYPYTAQLVVGGAFTQGGTIYATSTSGSVMPLVAANFDEETVIDATPNVSDVTLSFPATSTLASNFLPTAGMRRTLYIRNATTTAATNITVSGGTGFLLKRTSGTSTAPIIYGDTDGSNYAQITMIRKANTDIELLMSVFSD